MDKFFFTALRTAQGQKQKTSEIQVGGTKENSPPPLGRKEGNKWKAKEILSSQGCQPVQRTKKPNNKLFGKSCGLRCTHTAYWDKGDKCRIMRPRAPTVYWESWEKRICPGTQARRQKQNHAAQACGPFKGVRTPYKLNLFGDFFVGMISSITKQPSSLAAWHTQGIPMTAPRSLAAWHTHGIPMTAPPPLRGASRLP